MQKKRGAKKPGNLRQRFVEEYLLDLNGMQAAIRAGYSPKGAGVTACRLLKNPKIRAKIAEEEGKLASARIANATERREFWTQMMRNGGVEAKDRLKASELLGKAQGDFVERHEVTGNGFLLQVHDAPKKAGA